MIFLSVLNPSQIIYNWFKLNQFSVNICFGNDQLNVSLLWKITADIIYFYT